METKIYRTAVLIPCFNEEKTIGKVVRNFREVLPDADIYVYDNNSTDRTVQLASKAGAIVRHEYEQWQPAGAQPHLPTVAHRGEGHHDRLPCFQPSLRQAVPRHERPV